MSICVRQNRHIILFSSATLLGNYRQSFFHDGVPLVCSKDYRPTTVSMTNIDKWQIIEKKRGIFSHLALLEAFG
jgi:hypothetical protein